MVFDKNMSNATVNKIMKGIKFKILAEVVVLLIGMGGIALILIFGGWQVALGIFFVIWGNNLMLRSKLK